jgi:hypothetical protein
MVKGMTNYSYKSGWTKIHKAEYIQGKIEFNF